MNGRSPLLRAALSVAFAAFVSNPALALGLGLRSASVLYVADNASNGVYLFNAQNLSAPMLDAITTGVNQPTSIAVDSKGELYVANAGTGQLMIYKQGAHSPYRIIAATKFGTPAALALGGDNGLIVGYNAPGRNATLAFFDPGSSRPARLISIPLDNNASVSIGALAVASGSLYVSVMRSPDGPSEVLKFARGSYNGVDIGIASGTGEDFDAQGNFYVDGGASVAVYSPSRQEKYVIYNMINAGQIAVAPDGTLFVPDGQHKICNSFTEPGYVAEYAPGSQSAEYYLQSSYLQNPVSVALLLVR